MASSSSLALSSLLSTLHTHLNAQTQLLPQLHSQLGLPPTALEDELQELQHNLTRAVESQIDVRKKQVEEWGAKCEEMEIGCSRYVRALGANAKVVGSLNEIKSEKVLPRRHERALEYQERLRQVYHTKLEQLTTLTNRLNALARSLGVNYFSADILQPTVSAEEDSSNPNALRDVMPERFSKLEKELVRGKGEMTKRLALLGDVFIQIDWLHTELGIDLPEFDDRPALPVASSSTLTVPAYPLPRSSSSSNLRAPSLDPFLESSGTPTPSCHGRSDAKLLFRSASPTPTSPTELSADPVREFQHAFSRFVQLLDSSSTSDPVPATLLGSLGVEPTQKMMLYAEQRCSELTEQKKRRETHIQAMYDQLESLWKRMGVDDKAMDAFVEANRGTTPHVIQTYEEELERMIDLKRERMGEFIENARSEIESLWNELMTGDDERADFAAFVDDEHTEDLLSQHEHEIARLKAEVRLKKPMLASIKKYLDICEEEKELERVAGDQTRLLGRGGGRDPGRLLREEKMRKRVGKEKPKLEQQLLSSLPSWEQANGRPFLVHGESMLQILMEGISANEQENKKKTIASQYSIQALNASKPTGPLTRSRSLEPSAGNASKAGYIPGKMHNPPPGAVTPAVRPGSSMSQTTSKRQKLADGRAKPARSSSPAKGRTPSGPASGLPRSTFAPPVSHITIRSKHAEGYGSLGWGRAPSTTQRTTSRAVTYSGASSHRHASATKSHGGSSAGSSIAQASSLNKGSRIRQESFRPRPSIDCVRAGGGAAFRGMPPTAEE
ncbi:microtubule associated protein-domain-containing protein [Boletus edulis BED1]|uniref:Microtubule associated protein-domain-containing protein n=1 Tax=Boletus edulis BED1 TaxID=1328754 RepID=A0AAD4BYY8_BOLED|nr:microtubule associated protein-domain-containing protein [Boletus edulis BED1]